MNIGIFLVKIYLDKNLYPSNYLSHVNDNIKNDLRRWSSHSGLWRTCYIYNAMVISDALQSLQGTARAECPDKTTYYIFFLRKWVFHVQHCNTCIFTRQFSFKSDKKSPVVWRQWQMYQRQIFEILNTCKKKSLLLKNLVR